MGDEKQLYGVVCFIFDKPILDGMKYFDNKEDAIKYIQNKQSDIPENITVIYRIIRLDKGPVK